MLIRFIKIYKRRLFLLLLLIFLVGCCPYSVPSFRGVIIKIPKSTIIVVKPVVRFEYLKTERRDYSGEYKYYFIRQLFLNMVKTRLLQKGFKVKVLSAECIFLTQNKIDENIYKNIELTLIELSKGYINERRWLYIKQKCHNGNLLLALSIKVYRGQRWVWDPNTGYIAPTTHKVCLYAGLIDCCSKRIIWKNSIIFRRLPKKGDSRLREAIDKLLESFPKAT